MFDTFQQVVTSIYPNAQLKDFKKLEGGVSAQVFCAQCHVTRWQS